MKKSTKKYTPRTDAQKLARKNREAENKRKLQASAGGPGDEGNDEGKSGDQKDEVADEQGEQGGKTEVLRDPPPAADVDVDEGVGNNAAA